MIQVAGVFIFLVGNVLCKSVGTGEWHIHVTLNVYSGRPDPTWTIPESHVSYDKILHRMKTFPAKAMPNKLGYKGFTLVHVPPGHDLTSGDMYNTTATSYPDWEMSILATTVGREDECGVDGFLRDHAKQTIMRNKDLVKRKKRSYDPFGYDYDQLPLLYGTTPDPINTLTDEDMYKLVKLLGVDKRLLNLTTTPAPRGPTKYEPFKWNKYFIQEHNNCYNYANNKITDTFAQPGRAGSCTFGLTATGNDIKNAAVCDGLKVVPAPSQTRLPKHDWNLAALVFWPPKPGSKLFDFHWYRLDGNGRWSHKPGKTGATNIDESKRAIYDPRHANRGPYTEFIAFLETSNDKVLII